MILLDMVGDGDLKFALPPDTDPILAATAMKAAHELGYGKNIQLNGPQVLDDHTAFQNAGIPAIDAYRKAGGKYVAVILGYNAEAYKDVLPACIP